MIEGKSRGLDKGLGLGGLEFIEAGAWIVFLYHDTGSVIHQLGVKYCFYSPWVVQMQGGPPRLF